MKSRIAAIAFGITALACSPGEKRGDTTLPLPAVDTLRPAAAVDSTDTTRGPTKATPMGTKQPTSTRTGTPSTRVTTAPTGGQKAPPRNDSILGRDSVIKMDPRDPRRQLPKVKPDSTRPPR
jgi:hypothetical protein